MLFRKWKFKEERKKLITITGSREARNESIQSKLFLKD